ncbi:hypothetical protein [Mammaliicoccus sciuri]|uniref:hypothetical protein n=1 Tax=Mammaliicoccus sciuri TaxID=1296 RepID=UPI0021D3DF4C|nr:hypothetical protein [Mammaliicoccus sciuri]MEB7065885.1 hypothetical protein [Mammaliicoccus sciuri]UXU68201.1 hypothetical protein MUA36_09700 [Mammaliicoccus sciuri]
MNNRAIVTAAHIIPTLFEGEIQVLRNEEIITIQLDELTTSDYLIYPLNKLSKKLVWKGVELFYNNHIEISNKLPLEDTRFWYLIGRFVGDGWITKRTSRNNNISGIKICCSHTEVDDLKNKFGNLFKYTLIKERTVYKFQFSNKELGVFCCKLGIGAKNKVIPKEIIDMPVVYLKPIMEGLIDSDGTFTQGKYKLTTISRELAYSFADLSLKVTGIPFKIYFYERPRKAVIEGRVVNQNDTYQVVIYENYSKKYQFLDDNNMYCKVRRILKVE